MSDAPAGPAAVELSPEEVEERAAVCYSVDQRIKASLRAGRSAAWALAEALYEFDEASGWTALGYETLGEYLADPEVAMARSTFFAAVSRWRKMVVLRSVGRDRLELLDPSKVDIVLPRIESAKVKLEVALADVEALGKRDLREKYRGVDDRIRRHASTVGTDRAIRAVVDYDAVRRHGRIDLDALVLRAGRRLPALVLCEGCGEPAPCSTKRCAEERAHNEEGVLSGHLPDGAVEAAARAAGFPDLDGALGEARSVLAEEYPLRKASRQRFQKALLRLARAVDADGHYHVGEGGLAGSSLKYDEDCAACRKTLQVKSADA